MKLREMLGEGPPRKWSASHAIWAGVLDQLGLVARPAQRQHGVQPIDGRAGQAVRHAVVERLPPTSNGAYRILQEALRNIENHAHARMQPWSDASRRPSFVVVKDDGIGFHTDRHPAGRNTVATSVAGHAERGKATWAAISRSNQPRCRHGDCGPDSPA